MYTEATKKSTGINFKVEEEASIDFFANIEGKEPEKEAEPKREPEAEKPVNYIGEAFRA